MSMCPKCGKVLEDGMRFCDNCGTQILETAVCPNCGEPILPGYAFCQKCGAPIGQAPAPTPGAGYTPNPVPGAGYTPNPAPSAGYTPNPVPGAGYTPNPDPGAGYTPNPDPGAGYTPNPDPGAGYIPASDPGPAPAAPQEKKAIPKKAIMFGGIGVAALVVIIALVALISNFAGGGGGKSGGKTYMFYLRDSEIIYLDLKSGEQTEVTSRLTNGGMNNSQLANSAYSIGSFVAFSEDGSKLFYPDRTDFTNTYNGLMMVTLYYRDMSKPGDDPLKIDSDITYYAINKAGTVVIYCKGSDGNLYLHDLANKEKIASDVTRFYVADDCNKVLYLTDDGSIYRWSADGGEKTKVVSDITTLYYVSEDLKTIYYTKDDGFYKQVEGTDDRVKIASDVSRVVSIYDTGELYYIKSEDVEIDLMEYVNDDVAASDEVMEEPEYPQYPSAPSNPSWYYWHTEDDGSRWYEEYDYDIHDYVRHTYTEEEYNALIEQYNQDYAAYQEAYNAVPALREEYNNVLRPAWQAKQRRDNLRNTMSENPLTHTDYALYYYNGSEETLVTDALASEWDITYASGAPVLFVRAFNHSEVRKPKMSEIESYSDVRDQVYAALYSSSERYFATGATLSILDEPDASYFTISSDGSTVFFLNDISDDGDEGELYKITVENGQMGRPELYDSDVSTSYMYFTGKGQFAYYKDVDEAGWKGDFYIDKVQIDFDVRLSFVSYLNDNILYYTDWNNDRGYGTLKMYENGEKVKIADDVHSFILTDDGDILYLYDYGSNYKGTLYSYNKGKPEKIDDDVMALISVSSSGIKGGAYYYYW